MELIMQSGIDTDRRNISLFSFSIFHACLCALVCLWLVADGAAAAPSSAPATSPADIAQWAGQAVDPALPDARKIEAAVRLGRAGSMATQALPVLRKLVEDRKLAMNLRGYAAWAVEQIAPWPADQAPREFHVAAEDSAADDDNPGTADKPWKTIQKAAETLQAGDTVVIHNGTYRELVRPLRGGSGVDRLLTYRAAPGEHPIIKGSDVWSPAWRREPDGTWSAPYQRHSWDAPEKWPTPRSEPMFRCEQIFVDDQFLKHVATVEELRKEPGTFYTEDDGRTGRLRIHLSGETPPDKRVIERSMRQHCFFPAIKGLAYVRVQGLTMRHAAGPEFSKDWGLNGTRAVMSARYGHHWIIEDNVIEWGNAQGLDLGAWGWGEDGQADPYVTDLFGYHQVRRNRVNHNGVSGIAGTDGVNHLLIEDNETSFNGHKGNFYGYESAGLKLHGAKNCTIRRHVSRDNEGFGIWLDWDNLNDRVTQCILINNVGGGFFLEASAGPVLLDCNVILGTREAPPDKELAGRSWADGIYGHDANRLIATHNYVSGSAAFGVRVRNLFGRIGPGNKPTTTSHNRIFNNFLIDNGRGAVCFNPGRPLAQDNQSDYNVLWQKGSGVAFQLENGEGIDWQKIEIGKTLQLHGSADAPLSVEQWRTVLRQDCHSVIAPAPSTFAGLSTEQIRDHLVELAGEIKMPADENDAHPRPAGELIGGSAKGPEQRDDAGAALYNGIVLPKSFPLQNRRYSREPMDVPYLTRPPKVIPIDVGRQLFIDDFLIAETTLKRTFYKAQLRPGAVIKPDQSWEQKQREPKDPPAAMPFSDGVWFDPRDRLFKMWYMSGFSQATCYATSRDGIRWQKPKLDVVPGTNIVHPETRDSATIWLDLLEKDPQRRFKMMRRDNQDSLHKIHFSADGIHWGEPQPVGNAFDRSTFFYNPFRNVWVLSIRGDSFWDETETADEAVPRRFTKGHWIGLERFRRYVEGPDLLAAAQSWPSQPVNDQDNNSFKHWHDPSIWLGADRLDPPRADTSAPPELYNLDAVAYESLMLGAFSIWRGHTKDYPARDKINEICLGFSRDGYHWDRPWREPFIGVSEDPNAPNHSNIQSAGGVCLVVGDKLYFYFSQRMVRDITKRKGFTSTGLATLRRDGFASMDAGRTEGVLVTRPVQFSGSHLFVNVDAPRGSLQVEVLDDKGVPIAPFTRQNCTALSIDSTRTQVKWSGGQDLSSLAGKAVSLRFHLTSGRLFSFWVSPDASGASRGYVAAGGPGFSGPLDTVGAATVPAR